MWHELSFNFILQHHNIIEIGMHAALAKIEHYLEEYRKSLHDYGLPQPLEFTAEIEHERTQWESLHEQLFTSALSAKDTLNAAQCEIFGLVVIAALDNNPLCVFVVTARPVAERHLLLTSYAIIFMAVIRLSLSPQLLHMQLSCIWKGAQPIQHFEITSLTLFTLSHLIHLGRHVDSCHREQ